MRSFCPVHLFDTLLSVCYGVLSLTCWRVIRKHQSAIMSGNATGLSCYLICSCFFCINRTISLWILVLIDSSCSHSYGTDTYVDVLDLINSRVTKLRYAQFMLSSLALTFFYSSYTYFAYSLTKVLDMLTTSRREIRSARANSHFLNVYIGVMFAMWIAETLVWIVSLTQEESVRFVYICARIAHATSALVITCYLSYFFIQGVLFIRSHGKESGRGHQLHGLLKMRYHISLVFLFNVCFISGFGVCRRIQGVCFVSIVIFAIRWIILLFQIDFHPISADVFLFLAEVCPTAFMLFVFRRSGDGEAATPNGSSEVRIIKEGIKSSFITALNAKSLFSASLDEEDELMDEYSKAVDPNIRATYMVPEEDLETGLEAYWEPNALPNEYDHIPDAADDP